jgi:tetratricopeptide (TPR) repeat protein
MVKSGYLWWFGTVVAVLMTLGACRSKQDKGQAPEGRQTMLSEGRLQELNRRLAMNSSDASAYGERADWWLAQDREYSGNLPALPDEKAMGTPDEPRDNLRKALQDIKSALLLDTGNALFYCILGEIYTRLGLVSEADDALRVSMARNPELVRVYLRRGELALINRQHGVAFKYLNEALRRDKRLAEAYMLKGLAHLELKDTAMAQSAWLTAIEQDPDLYSAYLELGLREKDPVMAHRYFTNVLELKPGHPEALYARGMLLQELGYLDSARQDYRVLLREKPTHRDALFNLAYADMLDKRYEAAIQGYDKVIAGDAADVAAILNRGLCYEMTGRAQQASADYRECLRLRRGYPQALQGLSRLK